MYCNISLHLKLLSFRKVWCLTLAFDPQIRSFSSSLGKFLVHLCLPVSFPSKRSRFEIGLNLHPHLRMGNRPDIKVPNVSKFSEFKIVETMHANQEFAKESLTWSLRSSYYIRCLAIWL